MILRPGSHVDPFEFGELTLEDEARFSCERHARRRAHGEPLPGSLWWLATLIAWSFAVLTTLLSVAIFGGVRNGLWFLAVVFYAVGIATLLRAWGRS